MTRDEEPEFTEIPDGLDEADDVPTDGELRATGANGPKVSAATRMPHSVDSQVSHQLVERASQPAVNEKARVPKEPPC